jgi:hypothetical protein
VEKFRFSRGNGEQFGLPSFTSILNRQPRSVKYTGALDMNPETPEVFVDADEAAKFLFLTRRRILELARTGKLPAHSIGNGARSVWRFRLSELGQP